MGLLRDLQDLYGNCAWVRTKDQILDEGWFEGRFRIKQKKGLVKLALLARDPVAFLDKENPALN